MGGTSFGDASAKEVSPYRPEDAGLRLSVPPRAYFFFRMGMPVLAVSWTV